MKIAMLTSNKKPIPSPEESIYAPGIITGLLTDGLVERGHEVTLFTGIDSQSKAKIESLGLNTAWTDFEKKGFDLYFYRNLEAQYELALVSKACEEAIVGKFDIFHAHDFRKTQYFANLIPIPMVFTYHGNIHDDAAAEVDKKRFLRFRDKTPFIAISDYQIKSASKYIHFIGKVYHGIDLKNFTFSDDPNNQLLFIGRMIKIKRPDIAIEVAKKTGTKIVLAGDLSPDPFEKKYWDEKIKPSLGQNFIEFKGHVPFDQVLELYQKAKALIMPIDWDEPFGMVMIESMACGTPVVAFNRGAVPEIVKDGVTGFICPPDDIDSMVKAVKKIYEMPEAEYRAMRRACRKHVEENFTVEKMVDGYEAVYKKVIADWRKKHG